MQKRKSIVNLPLVTGIVLSISVHVAALYSRNTHTPAKPQLEAGRTVVQLTLIPSPAVQASEPEPVVEPQPEPVIETIPIVVPKPIPEPAVEPPVEPVVEPETEPEQESQEQIASPIEDKGVITAASSVAGIRPSYPRSSQKRNHEGTVVLTIQVLKNGKAGRVVVHSSSGFKRLDEAAVKAAKAADYIPAKQFGKDIESELTQPITFELTR